MRINDFRLNMNYFACEEEKLDQVNEPETIKMEKIDASKDLETIEEIEEKKEEIYGEKFQSNNQKHYNKSEIIHEGNLRLIL